MPTEMRITIAIITYRRTASLQATLTSLFQQIVPPATQISLLVVDNDVAQSAASTVRQMLQHSHFPITYSVAPERGIPAARNAALAQAAEADYLAFIDDDDIADAGWIAALYTTARTHRADVVAGCIRYHFPPAAQRLSGLDLFANPPQQTGERLPSAWTGNVLFSTRLIREWDLKFDTDFRSTGGSDQHFFREAAARGARIVMCREALVHSHLPLSRTRPGWLMRRSMRNGATMSISDVKTSGRHAAWRHTRAALADSAPYAWRLAKGVRQGHVATIHPALVLCFMLGRVMGLVGASPQEYRIPRSAQKSRLHIAYILGHFPTLSETFVGNEMRAMQALGHEITPIALHNPGNFFQPEDAAFVARCFYFAPIAPEAAATLRQRYRSRYHHAQAFIEAQTSEDPEHLFIHAAQIADHLRAHRCNHVHAHFAWGAATYAIAAAQLLNLPVSFTCHGSDVYARPQDLALKCATTTAVISVAPTLRVDLLKQVPTARVATIACGVDTLRFAPATTHHDRFLFAGRLVDCKGLDNVLAVWATLPESIRPSLDIIGTGAEEETLKAYVAQHDLGAWVHFLGPKNSAWLAQHGPHYRAFIGAFRQGSDGARDTAPLVLKEAMAMGLPIITTRFVDIPLVVGDSAILCPPGDTAALAAAVTRIVQMTEAELTAMGERSRARVQQFTLAQQAQQLTNLFMKCR